MIKTNFFIFTLFFAVLVVYFIQKESPKIPELQIHEKNLLAKEKAVLETPKASIQKPSENLKPQIQESPEEEKNKHFAPVEACPEAAPLPKRELDENNFSSIMLDLRKERLGMTDFEFYQKQREEDRSKKFLHYISNYSFHFFYLKAREELPLSDFEKEIIDEGLRNLNKELLERMRRFTSHEIEMGDVIMDTGPLCSKYRREILYQLEKIEKASADRLRDILELYRIEEKKEKKERRKMLLESMK